MDAIAAGAAKCIKALQNPQVRKATCYLRPDLVVKISRRRKPRANGRSEDTVLTFGKPNYEERIFLAQCHKACVALPVRKVQLKFYKKTGGA